MQTLVCPGCQEEVEVSADAAQYLIRCPYCNAQFYVAEDGSPVEFDAVADAEARQPKTDPEEELDGLRIRQLSALRRGAFRARSWCLIVVVICAVAVIQSTIREVD